MSVTLASQPPLPRRGETPVAAHGIVAPVVGFSDATPSCGRPLTTSFSPPTSRRDPSGASALSAIRLSELALNAVTTLPLVVLSFAIRCRAVPFTVVKSPPMYTLLLSEATVATIAFASADQPVSTVPLGRFSRAIRWRATPPIVVNDPAT